MKRAIDWFVLAVGLVLAASGARWMWFGWDIVQAERGWASLISGSVMLSAGLAICAIAWAVMRLAGREPAARAARVEAVEPLAPVPVESAHSLAPGLVAAGVAAAGAAAAVATAAEAGEGAPDRGEEETPPPEIENEPPPLAAVEPEPVVADNFFPKPPSVSELLRMGEDRAAKEKEDDAAPEPGVVEDAADASVAVVEERIAPAEPERAPPPAAPEPAQPPEPAELQVGSQHESAASEIAEVPPAEPPPSEPASAEEPEEDWLERTARELDSELGRASLPKEAAPPAAPEPAQPLPAPAPEPAVIGRYSSGDTNYLMFSDGSIEAQTPEGVMRFASLTELKRFVEARH